MIARVLVGMLLATALVASWAADVPPLPPSLAGMGSAGGASGVAPLTHVQGGAFKLHFVTVGQVVDLVYGEALDVPHVISDDVLQDKRLVSFEYDAARTKVDLRGFMADFLQAYGFGVVSRDGVDFVGRRADAVKPAAVERLHYVYEPRSRSAAYLVRALAPLFSARGGVLPSAASAPVDAASGAIAAAFPAVGASGVAGGVHAAAVDSVPVGGSALVASADRVVFVGSAEEVAQVKALLPALDVSPGELLVRGWVYEVSDDDSKQSAFTLAVHLLGGVLSVSNSGNVASDVTSMRFSGPHIDAAISALNANTKFRQLSSPQVRVQSGQHVRLNVGAQVPTLGSVSFEGNSGTPVQSVQYQDAGLIFDVQPSMVGQSVDVTVDEEISDFVATTTGVQSSPTKNTRQMQTQTRMADGEVIVIGGLTQDTSSSSRNHFPWLPAFLDGVGSSKGRTEILLVLQVEKI